MKLTKLRKILRQPNRPLGIIAILGMAAIGTVMLTASRAATPFVTAEPENGALTAPAVSIDDAAASNAKAVKFSSGSSSTTECPPYPAFPDANCTGPTGTLATYTGPSNVSTPGQVIQNVIINTSGITVSADNVTFRNCKIVYNGALDDGFAMVYLPAGVTGTTFDHCELDGQNKIARTIQGVDGVTVTGCNIHHTGNGIEVGTNITMTDTYMHDIFTPAGLDWHADGVQSDDSAANITIDHSVILLTGDETGAINIVSNGGGGTFSNVLIQHSLMAGGGYTVYAGTAPSRTINFKIINNHFSIRYHPKVGGYNIWYETYMSNVTRSGNVIDETGTPANTNL